MLSFVTTMGELPLELASCPGLPSEGLAHKARRPRRGLKENQRRECQEAQDGMSIDPAQPKNNPGQAQKWRSKPQYRIVHEDPARDVGPLPRPARALPKKV